MVIISCSTLNYFSTKLYLSPVNIGYHSQLSHGIFIQNPAYFSFLHYSTIVSMFTSWYPMCHGIMIFFSALYDVSQNLICPSAYTCLLTTPSLSLSLIQTKGNFCLSLLPTYTWSTSSIYYCFQIVMILLLLFLFQKYITFFFPFPLHLILSTLMVIYLLHTFTFSVSLLVTLPTPYCPFFAVLNSVSLSPTVFTSMFLLSTFPTDMVFFFTSFYRTVFLRN